MNGRIPPPVAPRPQRHKKPPPPTEQPAIEGLGEEAYESIRQIDTSVKKVGIISNFNLHACSNF